jgi:parvulin-like peptidyl-prolyl isomerase
MGKLSAAGLLVLACLAGIAASEVLYRLPSFRDAAGRVAGRGQLLALVAGKGIYVGDLAREGGATAPDLIMAENLSRAASQEAIDLARVEGDFELLRAQFASEGAFVDAIPASGQSALSLCERIAGQLRGRQWLEKQLPPPATVTEPEFRQFYEAHRDRFLAPARFRVSHIFLAAPPRTPPEVVEEKDAAIAEIAARLARGEPFPELAAELSEDEATKTRGGDLGFFSAARVPPEFFAEIRNLHAGETSKPFRTHLGFHIAQLQEIRAARALGFEEARAEIMLALENRVRRSTLDRLRKELSHSTYLRAEF